MSRALVLIGAVLLAAGVLAGWVSTFSRLGFGSGSWVVLVSLRVLAIQVVWLALARRVHRSGWRSPITLGSALYLAALLATTARGMSAEEPLRVNTLLFNTAVIVVWLGLARTGRR